MSDYDQFDIELQEGDCILAYTDALIESQDADGEDLGEAGVQRILQLMGEVDAPTLIPTLLEEIAGRFPENLSSDDVTVLVVRATSKQVRYSLGDRVRALARLIGTTIGAIRPGAERPPFPDLTAANVGGAIVPALERRWRKGS